MSFFLEESADLVSLATAQERSSLDNLIECVVDWCTKRNILHVRVLPCQLKVTVLTSHYSGSPSRLKDEPKATQDASASGCGTELI